MQLNVCTFNLRLNVDSDKEHAWPHRKDAVVDYIKQSQPDIFGTQEVLDDMRDDLNQALCNTYTSFGLTRRPGEEASTIFYNHHLFELKESGTFWLSKTPEVPNTRDFNSACFRVCTWGEFVLKSNRLRRFRVYNTHLDHISDEAKLNGMRVVLEKINTKNQEDALPIILMGDFNSTLNDPVIKLLKGDGKHVGGAQLIDAFDYLEANTYGTTFHNFTGETTGDPIDHIYVSNHFNLLKTTIFKDKINGKYPSDHYPVSTQLELRENYLKHSFHTHNYRCRHADGSIEDYVKEAKRLGFESIAFTDHVPFKDDRIPGMRMLYKEYAGYLQDIEDAKQTFNDITIYSGLECEYFRDIPEYYKELSQQVDVLILGQHFIDKNGHFVYVGDSNVISKELLHEYADYIEEALDTGLFQMLAHPDLFGLAYHTFDETAIEITHRIAKSAIKNNVALEININGVRKKHERFPEKYPYPLKSFWEIIAKDYPEAKIVVAPDAHHIRDLSDEAVQISVDFANELGLKFTDKIEVPTK